MVQFLLFLWSGIVREWEGERWGRGGGGGGGGERNEERCVCTFQCLYGHNVARVLTTYPNGSGTPHLTKLAFT